MVLRVGKTQNLFEGFCKTPFFQSTTHDRNTMPTKRVIQGPFTIVNKLVTVVYGDVNDHKRLFTIVITFHLGVDACMDFMPSNRNYQSLQIRSLAMRSGPCI